jgi:hypothetical protein
MKNEVHVGFSIWEFEDISHDMITKELKINPSKIFIKGENNNPKFSQASKRNGWILESPLGIYSSFDEQLNALLDIMLNNKDSFQSICQRYYCEISAAIYIYFDNGESTPSLYLTKEQLNQLSQFNIEVDFDLYCLPNS